MKNTQNRLHKLEQDRPQDAENGRNALIREVIRSLTIDEARFIIWVISGRNHNSLEGFYASDGSYVRNPTDHPTPTKDDEERLRLLTKPLWV